MIHLLINLERSPHLCHCSHTLCFYFTVPGALQRFLGDEEEKQLQRAVWGTHTHTHTLSVHMGPFYDIKQVKHELVFIYEFHVFVLSGSTGVKGLWNSTRFKYFSHLNVFKFTYAHCFMSENLEWAQLDLLNIPTTKKMSFLELDTSICVIIQFKCKILAVCSDIQYICHTSIILQSIKCYRW